jgi:type III pantothenate kinase
MKLVIDIGNTSIKFATILGERFSFSMYIDHQGKQLTDDDEARLFTLLKTHPITDIYIASVQPKVYAYLLKSIAKVRKDSIHPLSRHDFKTLTIAIDGPNQLGVDLIADAVAVSSHYQGVIIVVDVGTSTKILAVANHTFLGVSIAPGIQTSYQALIGSASLLDAITLSAPTTVFGKNTEASLRSGVILGHASMINGLIEQGIKELQIKGPVTYVITGGYASLVIPYLRYACIEEPYLTLKGIGLNTR